MNELGVKKLAEVEAFLIISGEIVKKADTSFESTVPEVYTALQDVSKSSLREYVDSEMIDVFDAKVRKTSDKLTAMMELYVGNEWDNPTEVLEWCSFFTGAAAAHCAVAGGLASRAGSNQTAQVLAPLQDEFRQLLDRVIRSLAD